MPSRRSDWSTIALDIGPLDGGEAREVRHELGVDLEPVDGASALLVEEARAEPAIQLLDAGVDVGAVEGRDAGVESRDEVVDGRVAVDRAMPAGELPAAADDARDLVARREGATLHRHGLSEPSSGTAVVAACEKRRLPSRTIRSRLAQFGSGQAISASLVIQSFGWVVRCLAASSGSTAAMRVDREALARRQGQHLAPQLEMVARARPAIDRAAFRDHRLDAQIVELEAVVGLGRRHCHSATTERIGKPRLARRPAGPYCAAEFDHS